MKNNKIIDKIKKLLSMANDKTSLDEACTAARMARKLMDKHQISELDLVSKVNLFGETVYKYHNKTLPIGYNILSVSVAKLNDCIASGERIESNFYVSFSGLAADVLCARLLFEYLLEISKARMLSLPRKERNSYCKGFSLAVSAKIKIILVEREKLVFKNGKSLVVCKKQLIEKEFGTAGYTTTRLKILSEDGYEKGLLDGKKANLGRTVKGTTSPMLN